MPERYGCPQRILAKARRCQFSRRTILVIVDRVPGKLVTFRKVCLVMFKHLGAAFAAMMAAAFLSACTPQPKVTSTYGVGGVKYPSEKEAIDALKASMAK